jgi:hypothetical protein
VQPTSGRGRGHGGTQPLPEDMGRPRRRDPGGSQRLGRGSTRRGPPGVAPHGGAGAAPWACGGSARRATTAPKARRPRALPLRAAPQPLGVLPCSDDLGLGGARVAPSGPGLRQPHAGHGFDVRGRDAASWGHPCGRACHGGAGAEAPGGAGAPASPCGSSAPADGGQTRACPPARGHKAFPPAAPRPCGHDELGSGADTRTRRARGSVERAGAQWPCRGMAAWPRHGHGRSGPGLGLTATLAPLPRRGRGGLGLCTAALVPTLAWAHSPDGASPGHSAARSPDSTQRALVRIRRGTIAIVPSCRYRRREFLFSSFFPPTEILLNMELCAHFSVLVSFAISNKIILCTSMTKLVAYNKTCATSSLTSAATTLPTSALTWHVTSHVSTDVICQRDPSKRMLMTKTRLYL